jgi:hypothetical protein
MNATLTQRTIDGLLVLQWKLNSGLITNAEFNAEFLAEADNLKLTVVELWLMVEQAFTVSKGN